MSVNNTNAYSFKSASSQLSNYKIYGSDKYTANYKIYGNTIDGSSVGDLKNLSNPNDLQQGYYKYTDGSSVLGDLRWVCTKKIPCKSNTNYTFSFKNPSRWAGFVWYDSSNTYISTSNRDSGFTNGGYYTAQSPSNAAYFVVNIAGYPDDDACITVDNIIDLMIKKGSTPSEYEPYGYKVPIRVTGKNLLKVGTSQTSNGVTFTVNSDGSVTCNGTASATTFYGTYIHLQKGSYIISGCPQNGSDTSYMISMRDAITGSPYPNINGNDLGNSKLMTITEYLYFKHVIRIASGYTCDNLTFYPMVRRADIEDSTYEPYREEIYNVYLDSPLTKSGDNTDYIDFKEQKRVNIDGTEEYIKLPEFNIESENDSIFIDTDTQPSNIDFDILHGVGDRTGNLFDGVFEQGTVHGDRAGYSYNDVKSTITSTTNHPKRVRTKNLIYVNNSCTVSADFTKYDILIYKFDEDKIYTKNVNRMSSSCTITDAYYILVVVCKKDDSNFTPEEANDVNLMINSGSTALQYKIPIRVTGKNLFIKPVEQGSIYIDNGRYSPNDTTRIHSKNIPLIPGKTYTISCNNNLKLKFIGSYFNDTYIGQLYVNYNSSIAKSQTTITIPENANNISVSFWNGTNSATVIPSDLEWCQIEEGETATEYEEPFNQISNIYLDKPLLKVGDNADYIDYSAQKKYTYNNTVEDVVLPDIPVNVGENKLMIDTLIKPSSISISVLNVNDGSIPVDTNNKQEKIKHIFKTTEDTLRNYQIYGSNKYAANYRIYGNTEIENLFDENSTWNINNGINYMNAFPSNEPSTTNIYRTYFMNVTGSTTYKINMTSCGDRLKIVYYNTNIDPTTYTTSNRVTATGVIYNPNGSTGSITSGENLCMTFTTPGQAKMIGIYYSSNTLPIGFTITKVKNNSVGNLVNLFDENSEVITYTYINDNGELTYSADIDTYDYIPVEPNTIYRAKSFGIGSGSLSIRAAYYDSSKTFISRVISNKNDTFTTPINCVYIRLSINKSKPIHDLQISLTKGDSNPATYEPYGYKVPIRVTGKNLLKVGTSQTSNGVTFTVNSDGSVTCNGTASANAVYIKSLRLQKGSYIISGCPQNGSKNSYMITMRDHNGNYYSGINGDDTGTGKTIITTEYLPFQCIIRIASGYTCDNLTFYPMVRRADIEDSTYEPCREQIEYLYLDSPLTKSGNNCDYIDFKEQKRVNIDGTEEYIKLPEFNIESENDSIFIDTDTQPSNIDFDILHGVGDRTENLFDGIFEQGTVANQNPVGSSCDDIKITSSVNHIKRVRTKNLIYVNNSCTVSVNFTKYEFFICKFDENQLYKKKYINWSSDSCTITDAYYILVVVRKKDDSNFTPEEANDVNLMINSGSTALQYEPPYKIPIKVQGKNLFNSSVEQGGLDSSNGIKYTSGLYYTNRLCSGYINLTSNKTYTISSNMKIKIIIAYNENKYISCLLNTNEDLLYSTITLPSNANNIRVVFWSGTNNIAVEPSNFKWGQIEEGEVVTEYEEPFSSTNNIYLNRPLLKDGSDYDYIDYSEQKRYNYDGTIENITIHHVLTNNGMNTLTFDSLVQPLQSFIKYYDEDAKIPIVDSSSSFEAEFTTSGTQLLNYRIWGTDAGLGNINLFDFDAWWETIKNNVRNGSVKRGKNQSFTITPTGEDAFTLLYSAVHSGGYRIYVEPNSSYTLSWNKECANSEYYGRQMVFLDGRVENGYMFTCTGSTSLKFTTKSDTSFIMLRFGCGTNTDTPITFSNITLSKNNSKPNILINTSDMNDISTWDSNLLARQSKTVETNSWVIGQIIDVTNINSLYIIGDTKIVYENKICVGKSNEQITNGSTLLSYTEFTELPQIINTSDCNYILISVNRYLVNTPVEQIKNTFKIYKAQQNTTVITLPRKLFKTDTNIEYIDYESQKLYSTDNVDTDISLPPISTVVGKNKLRIPPDKKPSKLMIKYLI